MTISFLNIMPLVLFLCFANSRLEIFVTSVVWMNDTLQNYFEVSHIFTKKMKEVRSLTYDQHFSFQYFLNKYLFTKLLPTYM